MFWPPIKFPSTAAPVTSVFTRVGAVVAQLGDYAASLVTNDSGVSGATVKDALNALLAAIPSVPVTSVFGRVGAVAAAVGDYAASQVNNDSSVSGAHVKDALNALLATLPQSLGAPFFGGFFNNTDVGNAAYAFVDGATSSQVFATFPAGTSYQQLYVVAWPYSFARFQWASDVGAVGDVFTVYKNGLSTGRTLVLTGSVGQAAITGGPIAFAQGDTLMLVYTATAGVGLTVTLWMS